jgi:hypothetical protein
MRSNTSLTAHTTGQSATSQQNSTQKISNVPAKIRPDTTKETKPAHGTAETYDVLPLAGKREDGESVRAVEACNDWLRMGRGRSLRKLKRHYSQADSKPSETLQNTPESSPPTDSYDTLRDWSQKFHWPDRSVLYDFEWEKKRTEIAHAEMNTGIALPYIRLREIKEIYSILKSEMMEVGQNAAGDEVLHNLWTPDVKMVGSGESAERIDLEKYNSAIIDDLRGLLADAAKETGGRQPKDETAALLQMLVHKVGLENIPDAVLERMGKGENVFAVMFDIINSIETGQDGKPRFSAPLALI